ncbi:MAG: hypothetical protein ACJA13_000232 [Paraglaciecola sp.]|jgi:hypothetical protein
MHNGHIIKKTTVCLLTLNTLFLGFLSLVQAFLKSNIHWFEAFKQKANNKILYDFLYVLLNDGDLHHHLGGSVFSQWWYELETDIHYNDDYRYYSKLYIKQCNGYRGNKFGKNPQLLLFITIQHSGFHTRGECEQSVYQAVHVVEIFAQRLAHHYAIATVVTPRLQYTLLRFADDAKQQLAWIYPLIDNYAQHPFPRISAHGHSRGAINRRSRHVGFEHD